MLAFSGFTPKDFGDMAGSTWRSRDTLGGLLSHQLGRPYQSWGVRRRLELHLAREMHYDFYRPRLFAKLFVYTQSDLAFGFYVEAPAKTQDDVHVYAHWRNFRDQLQENPAMREALMSAMEKHDLVMADYYRPETGGALGCQFAFREGRLQQREPERPDWQDATVEQLVQRIARLPQDEWVDLHVYKTIEQEKAIEMGDAVVLAILSVLRDLVPVYEMTVLEREV
jgi:hypothetical protein